jgi:hypothetical protein
MNPGNTALNKESTDCALKNVERAMFSRKQLVFGVLRFVWQMKMGFSISRLAVGVLHSRE